MARVTGRLEDLARASLIRFCTQLDKTLGKEKALQFARGQTGGSRDDVFKALCAGYVARAETTVSEEDEDRIKELVEAIAAAEEQEGEELAAAREEANSEVLAIMQNPDIPSADKPAQAGQVFAKLANLESEAKSRMAAMLPEEREELAKLHNLADENGYSAFLESMDGKEAATPAASEFDQTAEYSFSPIADFTLHYQHTDSTWYYVDSKGKVLDLPKLPISSETAGCRVTWLTHGYLSFDGIDGDVEKAFDRVVAVSKAGNLTGVKIDGKVYSGGTQRGQYVAKSAFPKALVVYLAKKAKKDNSAD